MATDPQLAGLFEDMYASAGYHPRRAQLLQLLANATSGLLAGGALPDALASALVQALQQQPAGYSDQAWEAWQAGAPAPAPAPGPDPSGGGGGGDDPSGPVRISLLSLFLATALIAVNGMVSLWLRLGLHSKLAVATIRCIVQLSILGYILVPIFLANRWWLTLLYSLFMLAVAAIEAVSRPAQTYAGMLPQVLLALGLAASLVISYGLAVVVQVSPWYDAQYMIPMLGMLLGNACSGIAVGLSTVLEELSTGRDKVELLLSMGASRMEATRDVVQRAVKMAMTPLLNQMSVVGIVSIPGMMTGQILGGSDPATAARYQIVIMFLIGATTAISAVGTIFMAVLSIVDDRHRLRSERLVPKSAAGSGAVTWIQAQTKKGWDGARAKCARLATRLRLAFGAVASRSRHRYLFQRPGSTTQASAAGSVGPGYSQLGSGGSHQEEEEDLEEEEELVLSEGQGESVVGGLREVLVGVGEGANAGASPNVDQPSPRQPLIGGRRDSIE